MSEGVGFAMALTVPNHLCDIELLSPLSIPKEIIIIANRMNRNSIKA
ncbi:hypothetical protein [Halobacteriovorax sp.]